MIDYIQAHLLATSLTNIRHRVTYFNLTNQEGFLPNLFPNEYTGSHFGIYAYG